MNLSFIGQDELNYTKACLIFAKRLGLIDDDSIEAVENRMTAENKSRKEKLKNNDIVYGLTEFSFPAYLQYELTRFKLDFAAEKEGINYNYKEITDSDLKSFYESNRDLFTRFHGDSFTFGEVAGVIKKRLREEEYNNEINDILCKLL